MSLIAAIAACSRPAPVVAPAAGIQRIASAWKVNTSGGFDRSASIPDIGPIPAGALIVVKACAFDTMSISDTAGNTYVLGTDGRGGSYRAPTMEYHCLSAKESSVNAFDFNIELGGGGIDHYLIAVEAYTGPGTWAYLAAQSGVTQLSYGTANTVNSAAVTTTTGGVATGIVMNDNGPGTFQQFSPGDVLVASGMQNQPGVADGLSGADIFKGAISAQLFSAGVGIPGDYKYLDFNLSVFTNQ